MVKGISRQVILVKTPDPKLFEQAIFILKEEALGEGVTEEELMKEANRLLKSPAPAKGKLRYYGAFWAALGAGTTALAWLLTTLLL